MTTTDTGAPERVRDRLRALTLADGRRLHEIAAAAGMARSQLNNVLKGHRANPSVGTVARILGALGRSWRDLD